MKNFGLPNQSQCGATIMQEPTRKKQDKQTITQSNNTTFKKKKNIKQLGWNTCIQGVSRFERFTTDNSICTRLHLLTFLQSLN